MQHRNAKSKCKIGLRNRNEKSKCKIDMQNRNATLQCKAELHNRNEIRHAKHNCKTELQIRNDKIKIQKCSKKLRGTEIRFIPDEEIFKEISFSPKKLFNFIKMKSVLVKGTKIYFKIFK